MRENQTAKPRLGISACLLGQPVRFDSGHKHDHFLTDTFGSFVEWIPVFETRVAIARIEDPRDGIQMFDVFLDALPYRFGI